MKREKPRISGNYYLKKFFNLLLTINHRSVLVRQCGVELRDTIYNIYKSDGNFSLVEHNIWVHASKSKLEP